MLKIIRAVLQFVKR